MSETIIGAVEAGGTKMVCAVGRPDGTILEKTSIPTAAPDETVPQMVEWFKGRDIKALGLAAFGPTGVNPNKPTFGHILETPKLAWRGYDFLGAMQRGLDVPVGYDTDVNAACLGEVTFGSCRGLDAAIYITVGTGVGVGVYLDGRLYHGMLHPEAGHIHIQRVSGDDVKSVCPYHDSCLEGLASGPAVQAHFGNKRDKELEDDDDFIATESHYLAEGLATYTLMYSPQRIVLGGGIPDHTPRLLPYVRTQMLEDLGGYIRTPELEDIDSYVVAPGLGGDQGVMGAIVLGSRALGQGA